MRLEPIEKPRGLVMRIAHFVSRRQLGAVTSPLKVVYARFPQISMLSYRMAQILEKKLSLEPEIVLLVGTQSALLNGCAFCADLHRAQAVQARLSLAKFRALSEFRESPLFSERERAILAFTDEVTRTRAASDAIFEELRKHLDERQIVELTWINAVGNYYNLLLAPLGLESDGLLEIALRKAS